MTAFIATALGFARRVPWEVWAILALLAAWGIDRTVQYRSGHSDGVAEVQQRLREAEAESLKKAVEARENADKAGEERALIEAEARARDLQAIERAEAEGGNALDALMRGDRD